MSDPGTFLEPVVPNLARVLAQAADSAFIPAGQDFYVVCRVYPPDHKFDPGTDGYDPYNVQAPAPTYPIAQCMVAELANLDPLHSYGIFGPFHSTGSGLGAQLTSQMNVTQVQIAAQNAENPPQQGNFSFEGTQYDAMFWSLEVVQKMVVPYYAEEYSPAFAEEVMIAFHEAPVALVVHLPWSEYESVEPDGTVITDGFNPQVTPTCPSAAAAASVQGAQSATRKRYRPGIPFVDDDGKLALRVLHPRT